MDNPSTKEKEMKITQKIIDDLEKALDMRKKDGSPVWNDGDDIEVCIAGTWACLLYTSPSPRDRG